MQHILRAWALDPIVNVAPVGAGSVNHVYCVRTSRATFFLRSYRTTDPAVVEREHHLITCMQSAGIPALAPIVACDGRTVVHADGLLHALYPQAAGRQIEQAALTPRHAHAAGAMLAQLHMVARSFPDRGYRRYQLAWDATNWRVRLHRIEQAILAHSQPNVTDQWALARVRAQQQWLADPACVHSFTPSYAPQVTHGDYHDTNLFFAAEQVCGIIDWEQAAYMPRAFEVARAVSYMFNLERACTLAFLRAYCRSSDIGPAELGEGAIAWGVMHDHYVWAPEEIYLNGNDRARRFIPHRPFRPFHQRWTSLQLEQTLFAA